MHFPCFSRIRQHIPRKLRTQALMNAGIEDRMVVETMGQKDKKNQNLLYYRHIHNSDRIVTPKDLLNPWRYKKKKTIRKLMPWTPLKRKISGDPVHKHFCPPKFCLPRSAFTPTNPLKLFLCHSLFKFKAIPSNLLFCTIVPTLFATCMQQSR